MGKNSRKGRGRRSRSRTQSSRRRVNERASSSRRRRGRGSSSRQGRRRGSSGRQSRGRGSSNRQARGRGSSSRQGRERVSQSRSVQGDPERRIRKRAFRPLLSKRPPDYTKPTGPGKSYVPKKGIEIDYKKPAFRDSSIIRRAREMRPFYRQFRRWLRGMRNMKRSGLGLHENAATFKRKRKTRKRKFK